MNLYQILILTVACIVQCRYKDYWGYELKMLEELSRVLDFTYNIVHEPDYAYGIINETGHWTGLTGMASRGELVGIIGDILAGCNFAGFQACGIQPPSF